MKTHLASGITRLVPTALLSLGASLFTASSEALIEDFRACPKTSTPPGSKVLR
jgi:hypothetical protein